MAKRRRAATTSTRSSARSFTRPRKRKKRKPFRRRVAKVHYEGEIGDLSFPQLAGSKENRKKASTRFYHSESKALGQGGRSFLQSKSRKKVTVRTNEEPTLNAQDGNWSSKPPSKQPGRNAPPNFGIQRSSFPLSREMKMKMKPQMFRWND